MATDVEHTEAFEQWWNSLDHDAQDSVRLVAKLLRELGTKLGDPYSSQIRSSRHGRMRELRIKHRGHPFRVLYAFDPRRVAVLLFGGDKTSKGDRWYEKAVPAADRLYDEHLAALEDKKSERVKLHKR
ncbi:Type II toxin-antitoxin system RelE/ParE family toxin [Pararobbsia alpina]|uniref:type II toxin-antitoxin system RelE/ParE family toxin n=1 Tax=Pararobbsia alpina TaxID=621374 RepID=UPI0039A61561